VTNDSFKASDAGYHSRHSSRTLQRAARIAGNIDVGSTILDVGCNEGLTSRYLLESDRSATVTGVELYRTTVQPSVLDDPRFELLEGNIVDLELDRMYDYVIYGAVHHHVLAHNGISVAIETLRKLVAHCNRCLFFETGQLTEGGRWAWQRVMRRYFSTDEEHIHYLLRSIEKQLAGFEVIGRFPIHGVRRAYLRIDIRPDSTNERSATRPATIGEDADGPYGREFGSDGPSFRKIGTSSRDDSPNHFWIAPAGGRNRKFLKQYRHHPIAAKSEWEIGRQIDADWAVLPESYSAADNMIVSPYLEDASPLSSFGKLPLDLRRRLAAQAIEIFQDAARIEVDTPAGLLMGSRGRARLIDVIDLNENNLLVIDQSGVETVRVIDFEKHGEENASRNRMHLGRILLSLRVRQAYALACYCAGWIGVSWQLVRALSWPLAERITARQPSLLSSSIVAIRSLTGRILGRALALFGIE